MNKIFTSLKQSKKLAKILPLESADFYYSEDEECPMIITKEQITYAKTLYDAYDMHYFKIFGYTPCWSLSALLNLIPNKDKADEYYVETENHSDCYIVRYKNCWDGCIHSEYSKKSLLDAAFKMVVWLKENNKI